MTRSTTITAAGTRPATRLTGSLVLTLAVTSGLRADDSAAPTPPVSVRLEQVDGTTVAGRLESLTAAEARVIVDGSSRAIPVAGVRRIVREAPPAVRPARATVTLTDGSRLCADDVVRDGDHGLLTVGADRIELPFVRIKTVAWAAKLAPTPAPPDWLSAVPEKPEADLVVVNGKDGGQELVACAITDVGPETVTVELDGELIPVKRERVAGLVWLRPAQPPAGGTRVGIDGGALLAGTVAWSPRELLVDDVRLPAGSLVEIDYAAGRTVRLATLPLERAAAEPFFGSLAAIDGMAAFFAPRWAPAPGADPDRRVLVVRPRTTAVWRVPADSRRFRTVLTRAVGGRSPGAVDVSLTLDDRSLFERRLDGSTADDVTIDVDVTSGRRLALTVDFVAGDLGCAVRFSDPSFEK